MSNVVQFPGDTILPMDPDEILEQAKGQLSYVLILGWGKDEDGMPLIAASSTSDLREAFYVIENYKHATMEMKWNE